MICEHCCAPLKRCAELGGFDFCEHCLWEALNRVCDYAPPAVSQASGWSKEMVQEMYNIHRSALVASIKQKNPLFRMIVQDRMDRTD